MSSCNFKSVWPLKQSLMLLGYPTTATLLALLFPNSDDQFANDHKWHTWASHPDPPTELAKRLKLSSSNFHFTQLPKILISLLSFIPGTKIVFFVIYWYSTLFLLCQNTIFCQFPRLKDTDSYPSQTLKFLNAHTRPNKNRICFSVLPKEPY